VLRYPDEVVLLGAGRLALAFFVGEGVEEPLVAPLRGVLLDVRVSPLASDVLGAAVAVVDVEGHF